MPDTVENIHPRHFAHTKPNTPAVTMAGSGKTITYGELEHWANQGAHLIRSLGLKNGDTIAFWLTNDISYIPLYWAAQRAGLYICPIATHLSAEEAHYIVADSGAKLLVTNGAVKYSTELIEKFQQSPFKDNIFWVDTVAALCRDWAAEIRGLPITPIEDEQAGFHLAYTSGTTGRPKGVRLPLAGGAVTEKHLYVDILQNSYETGEDTVYLCPAPIYHTAPLVYSTTVNWLGGHVIVMEKFDAEIWLKLVDKHSVTFSQMVPTMFSRLLQLPEKTRLNYNVNSLKYIVHAAAPCPVDIKYKMLEWLGPIIYEYYGGSEGNGTVAISPEEWLIKPGSVGKALNCTLHICSETGEILASGEEGLIYMEGGLDFSYLNDPEKTANTRHPVHNNWSTLGDIGYLDEDGFLYLTDRKSHMIISGGVNIYPVETENTLAQHAAVYDVAVIGLPDKDMGESVVAYVQLKQDYTPSNHLKEDLIAYCRERISHVKCPRIIEFIDQLPRTESGKMLKAKLRANIAIKRAS